MEISYPIVVLILGTFGIVYFRRELRALINRVQELGKIKAPLPQTIPQLTADQTGGDKLFAAFDNPLLLQGEAAIRRDLDENEPDDHSKRERILIRHLASTQNALAFERLFQQIWLSQLQLLRYLNTQTSNVPIDSLRGFYTSSAQRMLGENEIPGYSLASYFNFLALHHTISQDEETVAITMVGREFLRFLIEAGKPDPSIG